MKFVCQGRRSGNYKNRFEEMKSTRRECTALLWREGSNKIEKSETESSVSICKGHGFIDKALKKGYNQTRERAE